MRPKTLMETLCRTIEHKRPVLIKGAPGTGKSDIVAQAATKCNADLVIMHPVVSDPTDFKGLPGIVKDMAEWLPYGELRKMMTAKKLTVVFFDDLGQAPAVVQAACMQLLLARQINGKQISPHIVFIAATNRREDRAGVTGILEPVKSRFATILELTPDGNDWEEWAKDNDVDPVAIAFRRLRPELLFDSGTPTNDIVNRPSPRTFTNMARLYTDGHRELEVFEGAVGSGTAVEFIGFVRIWEDLPDIDDIIADPNSSPIPTSPAVRWAISTALISRITKSNANAIIRYATRLDDECGTYLIHDARRKCPTAVNCRAFIDWAKTHENELV